MSIEVALLMLLVFAMLFAYAGYRLAKNSEDKTYFLRPYVSEVKIKTSLFIVLAAIAIVALAVTLWVLPDKADCYSVDAIMGQKEC